MQSLHPAPEDWSSVNTGAWGTLNPNSPILTLKTLHGAQVERKAVVGLLLLIEAERRGDAADRALLAKLLRCFSALGIYGAAFQAPFLAQTAEFYAAEGLQLMAASEVPEYLQHCEVRVLGARIAHALLPQLLRTVACVALARAPLHTEAG